MSITSELTETRNTRLKTETTTASAARTPKIGDRVRYYEWDTERHAVVARMAEITELEFDADPSTNVTLTVFTPTVNYGALCVRNAPRGTASDHWDFA